MSEQNQNNDPLERLFRQKADEYDIQYKEEDWQKLETRLDEADRKYANQRRRYIAAAAVILLFSVLSYFTYEQQQTINQLNDRLNSTESENIADLPYNFFELMPDEVATDDDSDTDQNNTGNVSVPETPPESSDLASGEQPATDSDNNVAEDSEEITSEDNRQHFETNITESRLVAIANASPGFDGRSPAISAIRPINFDASTTEAGEKSQTPFSGSDSPDEFYGQQKIPRFTAGILVGPDLSTVGNISNFVDPGHKIGLSFEYNLTENLAITAGAQHSRVRYVASGNEYRLPEGYLPYGTAADEVSGECVLIDIPVSLKYDFMHFDDSRIYASAGLSSYIMLDEDYRFKYANNPSQTPQRWHEKTGTRHWMSNATISVGYEHDIMRNVSIRAEPFLKAPLKEVGWGNVNLYSMGSFVSINYKW